MIKRALLVVVALVLALVTTSYAGSWNGWIYQNPYPTSNTLYAVKFVTPQKGWVAGEQGTILYTEDGGDNWVIQESGTEQTIKSIFFVNERQGWAVGGTVKPSNVKGAIIHTDDGGKTWVPQQADYNAPLNCVFFVNEKVGWIAGDQGILQHTTDGGKTWEQVKSAGIMRAIASLFFINAKTGWLVAGDEVYRTTDGGISWDKTKLDMPIPRMGYMGMESIMSAEWNTGNIFFVNEKQGWVVIGFWTICYTADGGKTWTKQFTSPTRMYDLFYIAFADDKHGCASGSSIVCTEDGGSTWKERLGVKVGGDILIDRNRISLNSVVFAGNVSTGWAVGDYGHIIKTVDKGRTWTISTRRNECGNNAFFVNNKTGWIHAEGGRFVCRTDDGGHSFQKQDAGMNVWSIFFINETTGWMAGNMVEEETKQRKKKWCVIKGTTDGGKRWKKQFKNIIGDERFYANLHNIFFLNDQNGWVVGGKGTILFTQDGKHWVHQKSGDGELQLRSVRFMDSKTGWIAGIRSTESEAWAGVLLQTADGGQHWETLYTQSGLGFEDVVFTNNNNGWLVGEPEWGESGVLLHTTDVGKTWTGRALGRIGWIYPAFKDDLCAIVTDKGWFAISRNNGETWERKRALSKYPWHFSSLFEKGK